MCVFLQQQSGTWQSEQAGTQRSIQTQASKTGVSMLSRTVNRYLRQHVKHFTHITREAAAPPSTHLGK